MKNIIKIIRYIFRHIFFRPIYLVTYVKNYFNKEYIPQINYFDSTELVNQLKAGKSLIRLGDGELFIMNGGSIHYQKYSKKLQKKLLHIVKSYSIDSFYVLGLNKIPLSKSNLQLKKDSLLTCWLPMKVYWFLYFNKTIKYFDATAFYFNETIPKYFENYLKSKQLILVTKRETVNSLKQNKYLPFTNITYIEAPAMNAFEVADELLEKIKLSADALGVTEVVVLLACGPASKTIAYDLIPHGIVSIDVGRGIEVAYTDERIDHIIYPGM